MVSLLLPLTGAAELKLVVASHWRGREGDESAGGAELGAPSVDRVSGDLVPDQADMDLGKHSPRPDFDAHVPPARDTARRSSLLPLLRRDHHCAFISGRRHDEQLE